MDNIKYLYNKLLISKKFYSIYLRTFLIFYAENKKKYIACNKIIPNKIKITSQINKDYFKKVIKNKQPKIIILNDSYIYQLNTKNILIQKILNTLTFNKDLDYYIFNNLNVHYIKNKLFSKYNFKITIKNLQNKAIYIINIITKNLDSLNNINSRYIDIEKNIHCKIYDLHVINTQNSNYAIENFINIKNNTTVLYNMLIKSANNNNSTLNFFVKLNAKSKLFITDLASYNINLTYYYNFFLVGIRSKLKQTIFKSFQKNTIDYRESNIYHYNNNTKSETNIGVISYNDSSFTFNGNVHVATSTKNTDANLKCSGLILSNTAKIEFNPNMFINNNNVKCTHGASIGNINNTILNYLKSRGINHKNATTIITDAFISTFKKQNTFLQHINYE